MNTCSTCHGLTPESSGPTCLHCDAPLRVPPPWARKLAWVFGPVGAVLLAACYGPSGRYMREPMAGRVDNDHDGSFAASADGRDNNGQPDPNADCDDNDPKRYPGAQDPDGDGIDQNCDGVDGWKDPNVIVQPQNNGSGPATPAPTDGP